MSDEQPERVDPRSPEVIERTEAAADEVGGIGEDGIPDPYHEPLPEESGSAGFVAYNAEERDEDEVPDEE